MCNRLLLIGMLSFAITYLPLHGRLTVPPTAVAGTPSAASAPRVSGEIIVRFKPNVPGDVIAHVHRRYGGVVERALRKLGLQLVRVPAGHEDDLIAAYRSDPEIMYAESNSIGVSTWQPNDPFYYPGSYTNCFPISTTNQYYLPIMNAATAWNAYNPPNGPGPITVADLDSGVDLSHPDMQGRFLPGYNFISNTTAITDNYGHGTAVAGLLVANTNNMTGLASLGLNSIQELPVKVMDSTGNNTVFNVTQGIYYAVNDPNAPLPNPNPAKVINISIAFSTYSQSLQNAINAAWNDGAVIAVAAGNAAQNQNQYPAGMLHALGVSATNPGDGLASFSSYGTMVGVAAPGSSILTASPTYRVPLNLRSCETYRTTQGTSFASPLVASLAAMLMNQGLTNTQAVQTIQQTADNVEGTRGNGWNVQFGYGRINAGNALTGIKRNTTLGSIYGQAIDAQGRPVVGVQVSAGGVITTTGSDGMFRLANLAQGTYTVTFTVGSGAPLTQDVTVTTGADTTISQTVDIGAPTATPTLPSATATATGTPSPIATATTITSGTHSSSISVQGAHDSYTFTPGASGNAEAGSCAVTTTDTFDLYVYDSTHTLLAAGTTPSYCNWVNLTVSAGQTYTVQTVAVTGSGNLRSAWSVGGAPLIWNVSGMINTAQTGQVLSFMTLGTGSMQVSTCGPSGTDFDLYLLSAAYTTLAKSNTPSTCESLTYTPSVRDVFRLREYAYSGVGAWSGTITTQ